MKSMRIFSLMILAAFLLTGSSVYAANAPYKSVSLKNNTISSLLNGLESDNLGLKTSSALMLAQMDCPKAVIPLLRMLKDETNEKARITAAYALFQLKDQRGLYAIQKAVRFDKSEKVQKFCLMLHKEYLRVK